MKNFKEMMGSGKKLALLILISFFAFILSAGSQDKVEQAKKEAEIYARRSLEARQKPPRKLSPEQEQAEALIAKAELLIAQADTAEKVEKAIFIFEQATQIAPDYDKAWYSLAKALWSKTNFLNKESKPEKEEILKILAQAKQACNKALSIDPMSPGANYWLSNILLTEASLGNWLKGAMILPSIFKLTDKVAEVDPYYEHGAVFRTYAVVLTTVPEWLSARFGFTPEIILPYLDKAIELSPDYFANYNIRAGIFLKLGGEENKQKALQDLKYVLMHNPSSLPEYQAENQRQQKEAQKIWRTITEKNYPDS